MGSSRKRRSEPPKRKIEAGERFGKWQVLEKVRRRPVGLYYQCQCDCGTKRFVWGLRLQRGLSRSCGCVRKESSHGHAYRGKMTPEYRAWQSMLSRCRNENDRRFAQYGGRGIKVCRRWEKFEHFLQDMGRRPRGKRLGRLNVNKGYSPNNCDWVSLRESMNNRTDSTLISFRGKRQSIAQWARQLDINPATLSSRLRRGWPKAKALSA